MPKVARKQLAAKHKNCVRRLLLDIELDMVVPSTYVPSYLIRYGGKT